MPKKGVGRVGVESTEVGLGWMNKRTLGCVFLFLLIIVFCILPLLPPNDCLLETVVLHILFFFSSLLLCEPLWFEPLLLQKTSRPITSLSLLWNLVLYFQGYFSHNIFSQMSCHIKHDTHVFVQQTFLEHFFCAKSEDTLVNKASNRSSFR